MHWTQVYDPLGHWWLSTIVAALPIVVLLGLLAGLRVRPHIAAISGAVTALLISYFVFHMPWQLSAMSFIYGLSFGLLKIVWIVVAAVYLYEITVYTGHFEIMKNSLANITSDRRLQTLLVAFCFGAFLEGCAGFSTPVAIASAFMVGLGFSPFHAAVLNLIANTSPVAWGAIGTPVHTLALVSGLLSLDPVQESLLCRRDLDRGGSWSSHRPVPSRRPACFAQNRILWSLPPSGQGLSPRCTSVPGTK